jgi:hypothetical protein
MKKLLPLLAMALLAAPSLLKADVEDRLYDFTDAYYLENGVNPALIQGRMQPGPIAVIDTPIFSFQRNVRALLTLPAYDHSANINYFHRSGRFSAAAFTADSAGRKQEGSRTVSSSTFSHSKARIRSAGSIPSIIAARHA